ncbi:hypothetical protein ABID82_005089 [Methylobacterium sp. PvP062]|uniref:NUMOD4 domain-containing protein n=1 Tax=Methylobacterium radiotolerans TaxID=31998 RepID=A0ABV2NU34_9HYPH|nr:MULTISPECIES: NUMOD4 domain-containing protein [unclassified Methylobacterium]MBP2498403.1 hypothetical protein [Methylobacterium sp. PvP105]MBP2505582.1 hypothetical protein [Methylobacterium sp. PvP109]
MAENWLPVVGYEDLYEVSDMGRVRKPARVDSRGRKAGGHCLRQQVSPKGYLRVCLSKEGEHRHHSVHTLVLTAFVGPKPEGHKGLHGNRGSGCNELPNLRWGTPWENNQDRKRMGTLPIGERHPGASITDEVARKIKVRLAGHPTSLKVAKEFGVTKAVVDAIRQGRTWRHV